MAYIGREPTIGNFQVCDAISVVNGQAAYTMQVSSVNVVPETANHMIVSLNGVIQAPGSSYTVSGSTITFASNLVTGDVIDFIHILGSVLDLGVPSDDTVTAAKISSNAVTGAKLNTDVISAQTALATEPADTDEFLVSDAGVLKRIDYSLIKGGGGLVLLQSTDITSDTAEVEFTNLDSTYSKYLLSFSAHPVNDNVFPAIRFFTGSAYKTVNYTWGIQNYVAGSGENSSDSGSASYVRLSPNGIGNANDESCQFNVYITEPSRTDNHKLVSFQGAGFDSSGNSFGTYGGGTNTSFTTAVTKIKFLFESGNIGYGSFQFFGVAKA